MSDLIDRDELLSEMEEYYERRSEEANMTGNRSPCVTWNDAVSLIKSAPTVDTEPVGHGHWIIKDDWCTCSVCRESMHYSNGLNEKPSIINAMSMRVHYCPSCGAKMDGREEK